jgi:hypothetical protein
MYCGNLHVGKHPVIISQELFDKAQGSFSVDHKSKHRKHFDFAYAGLMRCYQCGYQMTGETAKRK